MTTVLEVRDLSFAFDGADHPVFSGVSFDVSAGERVGIVGANGAGKSTLLWCLLGLLRGAGAVRLHLGPRNGARQLAAVFQDPDDQLFMPRLIDDLMLPLVNDGVPRHEAAERARAALETAGLGSAADRSAAHLSLGERKRAALAAALVTGPSIIVLDEPTAELDARSVRALVAQLRVLPVTLVAASHDLAFLRDAASRLLVLDGGRLVADGPADAVLRDRSLLERAGVL